ncbi:MAG: hypothetical protein SNI70_07840 [Rikenellaceae bacterium]
MWILSAVFAPEVDENELTIEPIKIVAEKKVVGSIVGASRSETLKPIEPKPKIPKEEKVSRAQVPPDKVDELFNEDNEPMEEDFENEYYEPDQNPLPEQEEVINTNNGHSEEEVEVGIITKYTCFDYGQIEESTTRMVRGTATEQDRVVLEQLEGTDIFTQIVTLMNSTNLERVRAILNNT